MADTQQDTSDTATEDTAAPTRPTAPARHAAGRTILLAATVIAIIVTVVTLLTGGGVITDALPGLPPRDTTVTWLVPLLKLAHQLAATTAVGCSVAAAFLVDGDDNGRIKPQAYRWLRIAGWAAVVWLAITAGQTVANYADYLAQPLDGITGSGLASYLWDTENGWAYLLTAVFTLVTAVLAFTSLSVGGAALTTIAALAAAVPVVFTGHSAGSGNHQIAVDSMLLHVLGALLWTGGLVAVMLARKQAETAVRRYSRLALIAFVAVALSGIVNAATRVHAWNDLVATAYGREVLLKSVALLVLGGFGAWHRAVTLPGLADRPRRFVRIAAVELLVMGATVGLAVALSRTPSPPQPVVSESAMQSLLGFPLPGPVTAPGILLDWYPELLVCTVAAVAVGCYLAAMVRLHRRGDRWPISRALLWILGWGVAVFVTSSGMGRYGMVEFSVHMVQHMTMNMLVPILLVLAAPITLALRALHPASPRGPREWLLTVLHSRVVHAVSHPLIALGVYAFSLYLMYFTGLFDWAMRSHAGHLFMLFHFLAAGTLFYWLIIGPDPAPRRLPYPAKILLFFIAVVFHTIFGLTIMQSSEVIALDWYSVLRPGADLLDDQHTGGGIAWAFGEPPSLIVLGALVWQWSRSEEREARRIDRVSDRARTSGHPEDDPHEQYNAYLAKLAEADRRAGLRD